MTRLKEIWDDWLASVVYGLLFTAGILAFAFQNQKEMKSQRANPEVVIIDGCEYIVVPGGLFTQTTYTHKATCRHAHSSETKR